MGVIDDFLLGLNNDRKSLGEAYARDNSNPRLRHFTSKGFSTDIPDQRASTLAAGTALLRSTGSLPSGFFNRSSGPIAFDTDGGSQYQRARDAGVNVGSSLQDLIQSLGQGSNPSQPRGQRTGSARPIPREARTAINGTDNDERLSRILQNLIRGGQDNPTSRPFGSSASNNSTNTGAGNNRTFDNPISSFLNGFRPQRTRTPTANVSSYLDYVSDGGSDSDQNSGLY